MHPQTLIFLKPYFPKTNIDRFAAFQLSRFPEMPPAFITKCDVRLSRSGRGNRRPHHDWNIHVWPEDNRESFQIRSFPERVSDRYEVKSVVTVLIVEREQ